MAYHGSDGYGTATTSKDDSKRANYPILTQGGSDKCQLEGMSGASSRGNSSSNDVC